MPHTYPHRKLTALPGHYWMLHGYESPSLALCTVEPESQVTSDGPCYVEGCHFCPVNLWSSWETKLSRACCHFHTSLCEQAGGMSEYFRRGIGGGTELPLIWICIVDISGALHRALVPLSRGKGQEMFEDIEWWPRPHLPVVRWWTCENIHSTKSKDEAWTMQLLAIYVTFDW